VENNICCKEKVQTNQNFIQLFRFLVRKG